MNLSDIMCSLIGAWTYGFTEAMSTPRFPVPARLNVVRPGFYVPVFSPLAVRTLTSLMLHGIGNYSSSVKNIDKHRTPQDRCRLRIGFSPYFYPTAFCVLPPLVCGLSIDEE